MNVYNEEELEGIKLSSYCKGDGELIIFYEGTISASFMQYIVNELNQYETISGFSLVLTSPGGDVSYIKAFYPFAKAFGLKSIYGIGTIASAALSLLLDCKRRGIPVYMDEFCHVVLHRCMVTQIPEERPDRITVFNHDLVEQICSLFDEINIGLLRKLDIKYKKDYKEGRDVYLIGTFFLEKKIFSEIDTKKLCNKSLKK